MQQPPADPSPSPTSPSLPSRVQSHAPSPSLSVTPPSPFYDKNFFNSYQEYQDWLERRANYRPPTPETEEVRQRKIVEMLKHWGYGDSWQGIQPLTEFTLEGYIVPPAPAPALPNVPSTSQPQEEASGSQPRTSGCERRPAICPDNVYRSQNPTQSEQMSNREFRDLIEGVSAPSGAPGNEPNSPPGEGQRTERADYLVKMVQEGGADLIKFLLRAAVSSTEAKGKIPDVSKVKEWHFRDLMRLPKAAQEKWKTTCREGLEALCRRNVFKLTDLPKGRKTIGCSGSLTSNLTVTKRPG